MTGLNNNIAALENKLKVSAAKERAALATKYTNAVDALLSTAETTGMLPIRSTFCRFACGLLVLYIARYTVARQ